MVYDPIGEPSREKQGFRNNDIFVVAEERVVVMDPGTSVYVGSMILKNLSTTTDKPVVAVYNFHVHGYHGWKTRRSIHQ